MELETYRALAGRYGHLESSDWRATLWTLRVVLTTVLAVWLSASGGTVLWLLGQLVLAIAIMQWFFLLHDCGHRRFFRTNWLNVVVGHVASVFCIVPFSPWRAIHAKHHLWTGWNDLDPTQAGVSIKELSRTRRLIVDVCWALWIPIFTAVFGVINFWNLPRCVKHFAGSREEAWHHAFSMVFILGMYSFVWWLWLPGQFLHLYGLGFLGFFVFSDPLLLSQHSHMPVRVAGEQPVLANKLWDQDEHTRSIVFPRWVSRHLLFHFDMHVAHHLLPNLPGYHLGPVHEELMTINTINWWTWLVQAKRLPAHILLFQTRRETGLNF